MSRYFYCSTDDDLGLFTCPAEPVENIKIHNAGFELKTTAINDPNDKKPKVVFQSSTLGKMHVSVQRIHNRVSFDSYIVPTVSYSDPVYDNL